MNFLQILFTKEQFDDVFMFLKKKFAADLNAVNVSTLVEDQLVLLTWDGLLDPNDIAAEMTEHFPSIIIETPSQTGIETTSRYFSKTQLW